VLSQHELEFIKIKLAPVFYGPQCILQSDSRSPQCINRYRDNGPAQR